MFSDVGIKLKKGNKILFSRYSQCTKEKLLNERRKKRTEAY